jgi:hypothetical protein
MELSQSLAEQFVAYYRTNALPPSNAVFTYGGVPRGVGGLWYCPGCGAEIIENSPGDLNCRICNKSLAPFVYVLVELHPHKNADGVWR